MLVKYKNRYIIGIGILSLIIIGFGLFYAGVFGPHFILHPTSFNNLPNWASDNHSEALQAFQRSCSEIKKRNSELAFSNLSQSGKVKDWQTICAAAEQLNPSQTENARKFFETWFKPYRVSNNYNTRGLFTGYYLPTIKASLKPTAQYKIPIYELPKDLVKINLGLFLPGSTNKTVIGQNQNNNIVPYPDRAAINNGAIKKTAKVLAWCNSLVDVFFAQIQGSALIQLPNSQQFVIGYAGSNGKPYTAIGKILIDKKVLTPQKISMQAIRAWLLLHPEEIEPILNQNTSYTFFKILKFNSPLGSEQIPLTPQRSLAVDPNFVPLGAPIWLDTNIPRSDAKSKPIPFQHLVIAQDTGGAIKGIVRGDIYFGPGEEAALSAGHLKSKGRYWILLPKSITTSATQ